MLGLKCKVSNIEFVEKLREKRLLVVPAANNVIRLLPPLNISREETDQALDSIREVMSEF